MATLNPISKTSAVALPSTGSQADVVNLPFGLYEGDTYFVAGAVDQVSYTYAKLGGNILDVELTTFNVYAAYEEAVLEYSYMINSHQAKNVLMSVLGYSTGSFNQDGEMLSGSSITLKYPDYNFGASERIASKYSTEANVGGNHTLYSGSVFLTSSVQDYDLDAAVRSSSEQQDPDHNRPITVRKVYYKTPASMWRFFGFYGNFSMVGNMNSYGQYADDSIFYIVPVYQNKAQAMSYEDALHVRTSHYSYELVNNKLRLSPVPSISAPTRIWFQYTIPRDPWEKEANDRNFKHDGINNLNTIPFANLPYTNINSIGKQWIRRFALALSKEMLAQVRGKIQAIPIPNGTVTLNAGDLLTQAREEKATLKQELQTVLDQLVYTELAKREAEAADAAAMTIRNVPAGILVV